MPMTTKIGHKTQWNGRSNRRQMKQEGRFAEEDKDNSSGYYNLNDFSSEEALHFGSMAVITERKICTMQPASYREGLGMPYWYASICVSDSSAHGAAINVFVVKLGIVTANFQNEVTAEADQSDFQWMVSGHEQLRFGYRIFSGLKNWTEKALSLIQQIMRQIPRQAIAYALVEDRRPQTLRHLVLFTLGMTAGRIYLHIKTR